jgi:hypothetical protein
MRWAGYVARNEKRSGTYRVLVKKHEGKRQLGRPRRMSNNNIKMDLQKIEKGGRNWIDRAQDRDM